jgi:membrane protein
VIYNLLLVLGPASVSLSLSTVSFVSRFFPDYVSKAKIGAFLINTVLLTLIYKIFPNKKVHWSASMIAGVTAALAAELAKWGYAVYTKKALFYNEVYGSLAAIPLFLIWIFLNWNIFLGGSLFSYMIQHRESFRLDPSKVRLPKG